MTSSKAADFNPTPSIERVAAVTIRVSTSMPTRDDPSALARHRSDPAGPMYADGPESWRPRGATGFGTRLLIDLALNFARPAA